MRLNRFYVNKPLGEETFTDDVPLVHQIKNVLRLKKDDCIVFFNGSDSIDYLYTIASIEKNAVHLRLSEKKDTGKSGETTVLYLSLIKKELFELAVLKATELGVSHIVPVVSLHTNKNFLQQKRLQTIIIEASEQSGRNTLPILLPEVKLSEIVSSLETLSVEKEHAFALSLFGESALLHLKTVEKTEPVAFIVGPEGGWSSEEEQFFVDKKVKRISLSHNVLRAETAAIVCTYLPSFLRK